MKAADTTSSALTDEDAGVPNDACIANDVGRGHPSVLAPDPDTAPSRVSSSSFGSTSVLPALENASHFTPTNATPSTLVRPNLYDPFSTPSPPLRPKPSEPESADPLKRDTSPLLGHRISEAEGEVTLAGEKHRTPPASVVRVSCLSTAKKNVRDSRSPEEIEMKKARRVKWRDNHGDSLTVVKEFESESNESDEDGSDEGGQSCNCVIQ